MLHNCFQPGDIGLVIFKAFRRVLSYLYRSTLPSALLFRRFLRSLDFTARMNRVLYSVSWRVSLAIVFEALHEEPVATRLVILYGNTSSTGMKID